MLVTHFQTTVGLLVAIFTALSFLAVGIRWIYKQGVSSQKMVNALNANTEANTQLSKSFETYTVKADGALLDHEKRLTILETRSIGKGW